MTKKKKKPVPFPFWGNISNYALLVGGICHDMNNALASIGGYLMIVEQIQSGGMSISKQKMEKYLKNANEAMEHTSNFIRFLSSISREFYQKDSKNILFTDPAKVLGKLRKDNPWRRSNFRWVVKGVKKIPVLSIPEPIFSLIISEIISNSFRSCKDSNNLVTLTIMLSHFPEQSILKISSKDTGIGYPEELIVEKSFLRDQTGLYFISEIADRLGGWLRINNDPKGGARTDIALSIRR